ncbi:MAG: Fur family transcriptional regulator [Planctomycetota bacterium]
MDKIGLADALRVFEQFLEGKGMRLTRQRRAILERLYHLEQHVSADDLSELMRHDNRGISKATVYRTLGLLEESGLIEGHDFRQGYLVYEFAHRQARHDHILCVDGETVVEFQSDELSRLLNEITRSYGFEPISHQLVVYARCAQCKDNPGRGHSHTHDDKAGAGVGGHSHSQGHGHAHKLQLMDDEAADADDDADADGVEDDDDAGVLAVTAGTSSRAQVSARQRRLLSRGRVRTEPRPGRN